MVGAPGALGKEDKKKYKSNPCTVVHESQTLAAALAPDGDGVLW